MVKIISMNEKKGTAQVVVHTKEKGKTVSVTKHLQYYFSKDKRGMYDTQGNKILD